MRVQGNGVCVCVGGDLTQVCPCGFWLPAALSKGGGVAGCEMSSIKSVKCISQVGVGNLDSGKPGSPANCIRSGEEGGTLRQACDNALLLTAFGSG